MPRPGEFPAPLIGRERELNQIAEALRHTATGAVHSVVLIGDPGAGKTRLAQEILRRHADGVLGLSARAHALSHTAPFGLWADALDRHLRTLAPERIVELCDGLLDELAALLRSVAIVRGGSPPAESTSRARLMEALAALIANLAATGQVIIVLDDAHFADPSSWELLSYLTDQPVRYGVLVLLTARPGELTQHPVATRVQLDLDQQGRLHRVAAGPLSDDALTELAREHLGPGAHLDLCRLLAERSRGNALFAIGLLQATGRAGGASGWSGLRSLPDVVADSVRARVRGLGLGAIEALEVLAIAGGEVELRELSRISNRSLEELSPVLGDLVMTRLVNLEEGRGRWSYEISHPLIEETIRGDTSPARQILIDRAIGQTLLDRGQVGQAALHFARSADPDGGDDEAIDVVREALRQADTRGAQRETVELLGILGDLLPEGDSRWGQVADVLGTWMFAHEADGEPAAAVVALAKIASLGPTELDDHRRGVVKARLGTLLLWGTGDLVAARETLEESDPLLRRAGDLTRALRTKTEIAYARGVAGDISSMRTLAEITLGEAENARDPEAIESALGSVSSACLLRGDFAEAERTVRRALEITRSAGQPTRVVRHAMNLGWTLGYEGRLTEALEAFEEAKAADPSWRRTILLELESMVRLLAGDLHGALACAEQSALLGVNLRRGVALCVSAVACAETGSAVEASKALARARGVYDPLPTFYFATGLVHHAQGILTWQTGRGTEALDHLATGAVHLEGIGALTLAAPLLADLAEAAADVDRPDIAADAARRARDIADRLDRPLYSAMAHLATGWAALSAGRRVDASSASDHAEALLCDSGYALLHARTLLLRGLAREGERDTAREALQQAVTVFDAVGAVWRRDRPAKALRGYGTAGRRAAVNGLGAGSLTAREREIADLTIQRMTAQEIADLLFLSRRTVESHLATIYSKLSVHSKAELVNVLAVEADAAPTALDRSTSVDTRTAKTRP